MSRENDAELALLAEHLDVPVEFLRECVRHGVLTVEELPADPGEVSAAQLARLRRLRRLCDGLELDVFAGSLIVELLEQMDELRRDLDRMRGGGPA